MAGEAIWLRAGLRRVLAPNPSALTFRGTNTYLVGRDEVAVIDPGPALDAHLAAILGALEPGERISHIVVTHAHLDHSALAPRLAGATGALVLAFGDVAAGRSAAMATLAQEGLEGGEGADGTFRPDRRLADGEEVAGAGWRLTALHTPGHFGNHLTFLWEDAAFSGDHVMGWSTSLVSPPDGDMAAYMASLDRLAAHGPRTLYPGHGEPVPDGPARIAELSAHRRGREAEVLAALARGPADAGRLARMIYRDLDPGLLPAAARNVLAHLIDLSAKGRAEPQGPIRAGTVFRLAPD